MNKITGFWLITFLLLSTTLVYSQDSYQNSSAKPKVSVLTPDVDKADQDELEKSFNKHFEHSAVAITAEAKTLQENMTISQESR